MFPWVPSLGFTMFLGKLVTERRKAIIIPALSTVKNESTSLSEHLQMWSIRLTCIKQRPVERLLTASHNLPFSKKTEQSGEYLEKQPCSNVTLANIVYVKLFYTPIALHHTNGVFSISVLKWHLNSNLSQAQFMLDLWIENQSEKHSSLIRSIFSALKPVLYWVL